MSKRKPGNALWTYEDTPHRIRHRGTMRRVLAAHFLGDFAGYRIRRTEADVRAVRRRGKLPESVGVSLMVEVHPHEWGG